jgi:ADP-heptose:LPS heptosyltransferase
MPDNSRIKILVKLPVKLGDTVMAAYFLRSLKAVYPHSTLDVIMAEGLLALHRFMPYVDHIHPFSKSKYPGPIGNFRYGRLLASKCRYDLFFCLPFSFSSAMAGYFTRSRVRVGYAAEHRGFLLTHPVKRPPGMHIVDEFNYLLEYYAGVETAFRPLAFDPSKPGVSAGTAARSLVVNIRSGPPSRSIPIGKAREIIQSLLQEFPHDILLTGAPNERDYIAQAVAPFAEEDRVINMAGKTDLVQLAGVLASAECMVTADSGNAHVANAVGTPSVVLFGAAHVYRAKPYDESISAALQLTELECVPCESERCKYGDNRCLANIDNAAIIAAMKSLMASAAKS